MKVLFIGESWLGSCARSLKEALSRQSGVELDEIGESAWFPKPRARWLRVLARLSRPVYQRKFNAHVLARVKSLRPDVVMTYKGNSVHADLIKEIQAFGAFTVNIYPDYSPHAYGAHHRNAVGAYDLVISTKAYHPALWHELYGYRNQCSFVPHGYDPLLHLVREPPKELEFDVVMVATYRPEYRRLLCEFAKALSDPRVSVAIGGFGWEDARSSLPSHWIFPGALKGRGYISMLRKGKICIAPLNSEVKIDGKRQPGDVDTTRSYELAAAHCFFVHRRTEFAMDLYRADEVPMFDDGTELAGHVRYYLAHDDERAQMARAAHLRAVPAYSLDARAAQIVGILNDELAAKREISAA